MQQHKLQLNSNQLKLIALVSMTVDHVGMLLFPKIQILRIIGRIAFPIFAFMIAEGCRYTSNRLRYFLGIFCLGLALQAFFWFTRQNYYQHILITFSFSIAIIFSTEQAVKRGGVWLIAAGAILAAAVISCLFLRTLLRKHSFAIDYGLCGVLLPVVIYLAQTRTQKLLAAAIGLVAVCIATTAKIEWYSLFALPLLALYNGKRGTYRLKYLFYVYYPLHLVVLEILRILYRR